MVELRLIEVVGLSLDFIEGSGNRFHSSCLISANSADILFLSALSPYLSAPSLLNDLCSNSRGRQVFSLYGGYSCLILAGDLWEVFFGLRPILTAP